MKRILYILFILAGSFFGCVSNINDPNSTNNNTPTGNVSITVSTPINNDTISYKGHQVNYTVTTDQGINFIELHINGKYSQTFKPNSDGSKPVIIINLDSTYVNTAVNYQIKFFDKNGYAETPIYKVFVTYLRIPPYAPYGLVLTKLSSASYNIAWRDSSSGSVAYEVWRKEDSGPYLFFAATGIGENNLNDESVNPSKVCYYKVRGRNSYGYSEYSYSLNTLGSGSSVDVNAPELISVYAANAKAAVLTWIDNSNNENYFSIERKTNFTNFTRVGVVTRNTTSYKDSANVLPGTEYTYRVKVFSSKDSSWSNEKSVTTPLYTMFAPTITSLSNPSTYKVIVKWKDNDNNPAKFLIERKEEPWGAFEQVGEAESWLSSYDDNSILPNKTYTYRIRCTDYQNYSPYSNEVGISTSIVPLAAPSGITVSFNGQSVNLNWTLNDPNVTKVLIERRLAEPSNSFVQVQQVDVWNTTYSDYSTVCKKNYVYRLRTTDGTSFSNYSIEYYVTNTNNCK